MASPAADRLARLAAEPLRDINPASGFWSGAGRDLAEIWRRRELVRFLFQREIRSRYKDSALGVVWSLIRPIVTLLVYYLVIGEFIGARRAIPDFAVYVYIGLTLWGLFNESVTFGTASILANAGIIKKIHLPREVFPLASVGSALFNFGVQCVILLTAVFVLGGGVNPSGLGYVPLGLLVVLVWGTALAILLSALNVYLRDVQFLVEVALMVGFWASPIVYSWKQVAESLANYPWVAEVYASNPVTLAVFGLQRALWSGGADMPCPSHLATRLLIALAVGLVALFVAQRVFNRLQRDFAQEL
ncbi:MAG: ABC transporter permease [Propionibacteriaceae bacterium]|nr:ABC transporter permease [Propionibacteriaceae bacterium]